jgi:hypothetical protein
MCLGSGLTVGHYEHGLTLGKTLQYVDQIVQKLVALKALNKDSI